MEKWQVYLQEAQTQIEFAKRSYSNFRSAAASDVVVDVFFHLHHFVVHATNIDKILDTNGQQSNTTHYRVSEGCPECDHQNPDTQSRGLADKSLMLDGEEEVHQRREHADDYYQVLNRTPEIAADGFVAVLRAGRLKTTGWRKHAREGHLIEANHT